METVLDRIRPAGADTIAEAARLLARGRLVAFPTETVYGLGADATNGEAVAAITEALGLGVREPHKAYFNRGAAREALGDLRGAYEDYSTALEIQPDWGPANAELARFARARREHLADALGEPDTP